MYTKTTIALAMAPLALLARADVHLDQDDVPTACDSICDPIVQLSRRCDVDLRSDNDRDENLLEMQCVCTNDSFDVAKIAALCADCMRQNVQSNRDNDGDDDDDDDDENREDLEDINSLMYSCGFSSTSYVSSASTAAQSVTVVATAPTDISQLTTTISPGSGSGSGSKTGSNTATATGSSSTGSSSDNNDDSSSSSGTASSDSTSPSDTDNAAPGLVPGMGGSGALGLYVGAAFVAGAMMVIN